MGAFKELDIERRELIESKGHTLYKDEDFTKEEIARGNRLAGAVIGGGLYICKFCGKEGFSDLTSEKCK